LSVRTSVLPIAERKSDPARLAKDYGRRDAGAGPATSPCSAPSLNDANLSRAATKAELADKPGKVWLATAIGVLLVAYAAGLAGIAALPVIARLVQ
jgi:hypothetical protein